MATAFINGVVQDYLNGKSKEHIAAIGDDDIERGNELGEDGKTRFHFFKIGESFKSVYADKHNRNSDYYRLVNTVQQARRAILKDVKAPIPEAVPA